MIYMEDKDIRQLFADFQPAITDNGRFMSRLQHQLDIVDMVKTRSADVRKATRRAAIIAGVTGFVTGFLLSLALPYLVQFVSRLHLDNFHWGINIDVTNIYTTLSWLLIGIVSTLLAINAYSLSLALTHHPEQQ